MKLNAHPSFLSIRSLNLSTCLSLYTGNAIDLDIGDNGLTEIWVL